MMVWKARQLQMVARTRAIAQASVGGDAAVDAFSEFRDLVNRVELKDRNDKMKQQLEKVKEMKEIRFTPLAMPEKAKTMKTVDASRVLPNTSASPDLKPISRTTPKKR